MNYEPLHQILSGLGMVSDDVNIRTEDNAHQLIENEEIEQLNTEERKKIAVMLFVLINMIIRYKGYFVLLTEIFITVENLIADVLERQTTEPKQITQKPFVPCIEPCINIVEEPGDTRFR